MKDWTKSKIRELNYTEMGRRIKLQREHLGMTREQMAEQLEVSAKFVNDIEYGYKGMSLKRLYILCQVLGVSADYVLVGVKDVEGDETAIAKERVVALLDRCAAEDITVVEKIVRIYAEGVREKKA